MLDTLQVGLDLVGLVPGVGEVADGLNAVIYYARGDKVNAALSLGAMIPIAGMTVTGGKLVTKGAKAFNGVVDGIKTVTNKGPIGQLKEKATKKLDTVKDKFQTKVAEVKDQFRQLGTPQLELAGVNVGRITDTGTFGKNKPSNSSKPPAKDRKPAEGTKGTGEGTGLKSRKLSSEQIELDWLADKYTAVEVKGTVKVSGKEVDVSRRVYQIEIDKNYVPNNPKALGKSNRELMKKGNYPYIVKDGGGK